ncbi:MAG: hypothetical protein DI626_10885 [Micavibrio aeruginosavorus]|uniref:Secreted protein n=1 Tax=Micavibrio aeruginosavorus TaxID=349221 RepID=A0A2W4ZI84_9BACT|nr:MAG: hypothetical protein DI626_10885 [Micavibrio aeruginosavorus]
MSHDAMGHGGEKMEAVDARNTVKLALEPAAALKAGKTTQVTVKLNAATDGKPLTFDDLKEAHTKKLHLLVIDPSLSDYHHIHPVAGKNPGEYVFDFTPLKNDSYRVWADVIPVATDKQEYVQADMGSPAEEKASIDKATSMTATVEGYTFTLSLDGEPKAGAPVMGSVTVSKDGQPFTQLEPVMGAFAHVVGFTEDYNSVLHVHPMGKEPSSDAERGGPKLEFHIEPEKAGFVKLFAQVRIGGKDIFAPFGITVK